MQHSIDHTEVTTWTLESGITLSGLEAGSGDLVLLLHGFPAYHKTWLSYIGPLSQNHKVVALDLRGYYRSSKPPGIAAYDSEAIAGDIADFIQEGGYGKATLVGHDWGGAIAWTLASRHRDLVQRVAVYNCPHPKALSRHLRTNPRQMRRSWYIFFLQLPWLPEFLISRFSMEFIKLAFAARRGTFTESDLEEYRRALMLPGVLRASINYYRAAAREALKKRSYPRITCPSLLIWGEKDRALGRELAEDTERYLEGPFERVYFAQAGHWTPNELGEEGLALLRDFLSRV